jgi:hypothetical protein
VEGGHKEAYLRGMVYVSAFSNVITQALYLLLVEFWASGGCGFGGLGERG